MEIKSINLSTQHAKSSVLAFNGDEKNKNIYISIKSDLNKANDMYVPTNQLSYTPNQTSNNTKTNTNSIKQTSSPERVLSAAELAIAPPEKFNSENYKLFPKKLDPNFITYNAQQAIQTFNKLKNGNYISPYMKENVREINLSFLDCIKNPRDKQEFVKYYEKLTGFPYLNNVASKMKQEFLRAVKATSESMKNDPQFKNTPEFFDILGAGFDGVSSVGRNLALPGGDLNNAYVVLKGHKDMKEWHAEYLCQRFQQELAKNTDHRILSYSHHHYSIPHVYTQNLIESWLPQCQEATARVFSPGLLTVLIPFLNSWKIERSAEQLKEDEDNLHWYCENPYYTNTFFNRICPVSTLPQDIMFLFGLFLESIYKGEQLIPYQYPELLEKYTVAYYLNLSQVDVQNQNAGKLYKDTHLERQHLTNAYKSWNTNEKFNFIKAMIKASTDNNYDYPKYFKSSQDNSYKELKQANILCEKI